MKVVNTQTAWHPTKFLSGKTTSAKSVKL